MVSADDVPTYDVALSYAWEDRAYAERLASALRHRGVTAFCDDDRAVSWGEDLYDFLSNLYYRRARHCVLLVSAHYAGKQWTALERRAAQARALNEHGYLLPVRLDETELPGLLPTVAYLSWPPEDEQTIADAVVRKLASRGAPVNAPPPAARLPPLRIDDVMVKEARGHMVLDVRIRNAGPQVINVTRADVHVLHRDVERSPYTPSAVYEMMLKDTHNVIAVGHVLKPNEVDGFLIKVGYTWSGGGRAELILHYNGDHKVISGPFGF